MKKYDPKHYWNSKARTFSNDATRAACTTSPILNACIERTQRRAIEACFRELNRRIAGPKGRVLDFGCGSGRWVEALSTFSEEYAGVDIADEMISACRIRHPRWKFETMIGTNIPYPDNHFDLAFSIAVIHHNRFEDQEALVLELGRILKPDGMLFLFESVGLDSTEREFPRRLDAWVDFVESLGFTCIYKRRYEYWPLTSVWDKRMRRGSPFRGIVMRLDRLISPLLSEQLVSSDSGRAALLFRRSNQQRGVKFGAPGPAVESSHGLD